LRIEIERRDVSVSIAGDGAMAHYLSNSPFVMLG
jgi:hypothetical protein